jgi:hypothetical protein
MYHRGMARDTDSSKLSELGWDVVKLRDQVKSMEKRMEKQAAVMRAVAELLQEKTGLPPVELLARIMKIESDRAAVEHVCPGCQRPLKPKSRKCLYCGTELPAETLFDLL